MARHGHEAVAGVSEAVTGTTVVMGRTAVKVDGDEKADLGEVVMRRTVVTANGDEKAELGETMKHRVTVRCFVEHAAEEGHKSLYGMQVCAVLGLL